MKPPFNSVRYLPSGRVNARYRPRNAEHRTKTFDTLQEAEEWLESLESSAVDGGDVSRVTKRREYVSRRGRG